MSAAIGRRRILAGAGAALMLNGVAGCAGRVAPAPPAAAPQAPSLSLIPPHASLDRLTRITVCSRPFRAEGPRLAWEQIAGKAVLHHYGHGGSGWSLSWGSGRIAVQMALASGSTDLAVIGCGAIGLTTAIVAQRAGARVTLYAKDLPPNVRSSLATGVWSPDSRICLQPGATPAFKAQWQDMCRTSYQAYQSVLGLAGTPVEYIDMIFVGDQADAGQGVGHGEMAAGDNRPPFAKLQHELVPELMPEADIFAPGQHPLGSHTLRRSPLMMFNIPAYSRLLLDEFHGNGGHIEVREFHSPGDFATLPQKVLINCTGYGARALLNDRSVIPVRGQLAHLIPQPEVSYALYHDGMTFVPRRDGLVFQVVGQSDYYGFDNDSTAPDPAEAAQAIAGINSLFSHA